MDVKFKQGKALSSLEAHGIDPGALYIVTDVDELFYDTEEGRSKIIDTDTLVYELNYPSGLQGVGLNMLVCKTLPVANNSWRGTFLLLDTGDTDELYVCRKLNGGYSWMHIASNGEEAGSGDGSELIPPSSGGNDNTSNTTAVLGIAILGKMKLGSSGTTE